MADFIFKPSANSAGDFSNALEFEGLDPAESVAVADGTYDVYEKVVTAFDVVEISAQFDVATIGEEPVISAVSGNVSVTIGSGIHAGTYTVDVFGVPLTVAGISTVPVCIKRPTVTGSASAGGTLTIVPGIWLFAGADPGDQTWQHQLDGVDIPGSTGLAYTVSSAAVGSGFTVEETFGGVMVESAITPITGASFSGPLDLGSKLVAWLDLSDASALFTDVARTSGVTNGSNIRGITDKSGNGNHAQIDANGITWNASAGQVEHAGGVAIKILDGTIVPASGELFTAIKTAERFNMMGVTFGNFRVAQVQSGSGSNTDNNANGSPFYMRDGADVSPQANRGDLFNAYATNTGMVAHARSIDFSYISLLNAGQDDLTFLAGTAAGAEGLVGSSTQVLLVSALTAQERSDLVNWISARTPS